MRNVDWYYLASCMGWTDAEKIACSRFLREPEQLLTSDPDFSRLAGISQGRRLIWKDHIHNRDKIEGDYFEMTQKGIRFLAYPESDYPEMLRNIYDPPFGLFLRGRLPVEGLPSTAIVGARDCTPYGRAMAQSFAAELASAGVSIVSGMAHGVDKAAHQGALQVQGYTLAVLGCGVDICYPKENYILYEHMIETGGVLSEFLPGTCPKGFHFPRRNRIISGLSMCVLVMEAREKSGSLITVEHALEQGKDIFALPGRVGDPLSAGCNRLIQNGAQLLSSPEEILDYLRISSKISVKEKEKGNLVLADREKLVYSCLDLTPKHVQEIMEQTKLPFSTVAMALLTLQQKGAAVKLSRGYFARNKGL